MFTIIIPTYNHAEFLKRSLKSVIDQTCTDWECIIVDNHSTDKTEDVVASFNESRFRLLKIHNNGIIGASRNLGISNARADWVAFLDSDDFWYPSKLATVAAEIDSNPGLDVVSTDELVVMDGEGPRSTLRYGPYCDDFYKTMLLEGNRLSTSATVVRRQFLEEHALRFREDKEFVTVEDYDLWLRIARAGARFSFLSSIEGEYLIHGSNSSGNVERHYRNLKFMLRDHVFRAQGFTQDKEELWQQILVRVALGEAKALIAAGQTQEGIKLLASTMVRAPVAVPRQLLARVRRRNGRPS